VGRVRESYTKGDRISGKIKSITDFGTLHRPGRQYRRPGASVRHLLARDRRGSGACVQEGRRRRTVILSIDPERERISLGIKQLEGDPFNNFADVTTRVRSSPASSVEVDAKGAVVQLAEGVQGTLKASEISRDRIEDARNVLNMGDSVEAKIINVDRKTPRDRAVDQGQGRSGRKGCDQGVAGGG
jgi:small subunit ribosomal protein S1